MPRFVILEHDHPFLHWDFMIQVGEVLRTWKLVRSPLSETGPIEAEPLGDHRLAYLEYEGPVSGQRGSVKRRETGTYRDLGKKDGVAVILEGTILRGTATLKQGPEGRWCFLFSPDPAQEINP